MLLHRVQHYRSECRSYRVDQKQKQSQLNSCGNSECSDEEEVEVRGVHFIRLPPHVIRGALYRMPVPPPALSSKCTTAALVRVEHRHSPSRNLLTSSLGQHHSKCNMITATAVRCPLQTHTPHLLIMAQSISPTLNGEDIAWGLLETRKW